MLSEHQMVWYHGGKPGLVYSWGHKPAVRDLRSVNAQLLAKEGWANAGRCCFWASVLVSAQWPVLQRNCPKFLILALKVVFAAFSVWIWQCRTGAAETQLPLAASAVKSLGWPWATCVPNFFSFWRLLWVILVGKRRNQVDFRRILWKTIWNFIVQKTLMGRSPSQVLVC